MPLTVNDIKSVQFLLIVRAGLAVMENSEKSLDILHSDSLLEFTTAVKNYRLSSAMSDIDKSAFMRTKNFLFPVANRQTCILVNLFGGNLRTSDDEFCLYTTFAWWSAPLWEKHVGYFATGPEGSERENRCSKK